MVTVCGGWKTDSGNGQLEKGTLMLWNALAHKVLWKVNNDPNTLVGWLTVNHTGLFYLALKKRKREMN